MRSESKLRVLFFGTANTGPGYPRARVYLRGLREAGVDVRECRQPLLAARGERVDAARLVFSPRNLWQILRSHLALARRFFAAEAHDVVLVGPEGHLDVLLLRLLAPWRRKPVVFDPFVSLYDTIVDDRHLVAPGSPQARLLLLLDRLACRLADAVLIETDEMIRHYSRDFGIPAGKLFRLFIGEEPDLFSPPGGEPLPEPASGRLRAIWFGTHIPLHGVAVIVDAARLLQDEAVDFLLVGTGQGLEEARARARGLSNVTFVPQFLPAAELRDRIHESHVALGIFGTTKKAGRVVPCKVYDVLSAGRPLVTASTPAVAELIADRQQALLTRPGDAESLARALLLLRDDAELRMRLARAGMRLYRERATPAVLGAELAGILRNVATPG